MARARESGTCARTLSRLAGCTATSTNLNLISPIIRSVMAASMTHHIVYPITLVPLSYVMQSKALVDKLEGADAAELSSRVERLLKADVGAGGQALKQLEGLRARLTRLINASPVMLFMKGTPNEPRCKFSRRAVDMLKEMGVPFGSFGE